MKRSIVLIGIGVTILGISVLGGLYLMESEEIEKTNTLLPIIESELQEQEKSVSVNVKCSPNALGNIRCLP